MNQKKNVSIYLSCTDCATSGRCMPDSQAMSMQPSHNNYKMFLYLERKKTPTKATYMRQISVLFIFPCGSSTECHKKPFYFCPKRHFCTNFCTYTIKFPTEYFSRSTIETFLLDSIYDLQDSHTKAPIKRS